MLKASSVSFTAVRIPLALQALFGPGGDAMYREDIPGMTEVRIPLALQALFGPLLRKGSRTSLSTLSATLCVLHLPVTPPAGSSVQRTKNNRWVAERLVQ